VSRLKERLFFTEQMGALLEAGLPFLDALQAILDGGVEGQMETMVETLRGRVAVGTPISTVLAEWPKFFDNLYVSMVKAGEESGTLPETFRALGRVLKKRANIRSMIRSASIYPLSVFTVATGVMLIMMNFVIPKFIKLFTSSHMTLPWPTRVVEGISDAVNSHFSLLLFCVGAAGAAGWFFLRRTNTGTWVFDSLRLKTPVIGGIFSTAILSDMSGILARLYRSGVHLTSALELTAEASNSEYFSAALLDVLDRVRGGMPLTESVAESSTQNGIEVFPRLFVQMVSIGERTGGLDTALENAAKYYEELASARLERMKELIEPVTMVVMGVIVGFFLVALYMPMFEMGSAILKQG
jgi:type IV pilus assembly protein PilC